MIDKNDKAQLDAYVKGFNYGVECKVEFLHEFVNKFTDIEISLPAIKHMYNEFDQNHKKNNKERKV